MHKVLAIYQAPKKQYPVSARIVQIQPNKLVVFVEHETAGTIYTKSYGDFDSAEKALYRLKVPETNKYIFWGRTYKYAD